MMLKMKYNQNKNNNSYTNKDLIKTLYHEGILLLHLAIPTICIQLCLYFIFPQGASFVGRLLGTTELAGYSLGSLISNLTCLSVMIGSLSAADTLMSHAYGSKQYNLLGILCIQSFIVCSMILLPLAILFLFKPKWIQYILITILHQDIKPSQLASYWIQIYTFGIPANLLFRIIQRFLMVQHKPWPPVYVTFLTSFIITPIMLYICVTKYGFIGSAISIVTVQWLSTIFLILYLYIKPNLYHPNSWPITFSFHTATTIATSSNNRISLWSYIQQAIQPGPLKRFMHLSLGGVLSLSEWWFWEVMCFVAGTFGEISLCAHTIAYNLVPLLYMIASGLCMGLTIRLGTLLSRKKLQLQQQKQKQQQQQQQLQQHLKVKNESSSSSSSTSSSNYDEQHYNNNNNNNYNNNNSTISTVSNNNTISIDPITIAKWIAFITMICTILFVILECIIIYYLKDFIIRLFTTDSNVIIESNKIWFNLCIYVIIFYIGGINTGIIRAFGKQWYLAGIIICCLWFGVLPCILYFTTKKSTTTTTTLYYDNDDDDDDDGSNNTNNNNTNKSTRYDRLQIQWMILPIGYAIAQIWIILIYTTCIDWRNYNIGITNTTTTTNSTNTTINQKVINDDGDNNNNNNSRSSSSSSNNMSNNNENDKSIIVTEQSPLLLPPA